MAEPVATRQVPFIDEVGSKVLHEFADLHRWESPSIQLSGRLTARILERNGKLFLDLREFQVTPSGSGYTKRGLRLSIFEVDKLMRMLPEARPMLQRKGESECSAKSVTGAAPEGSSQQS
jgi:hypothetical protein